MWLSARSAHVRRLVSRRFLFIMHAWHGHYANLQFTQGETAAEKIIREYGL
jgi:hypothetical protein